ncbi:hypothetical protein L0668_19350 [Paraglaciecola aquimarina]|uniref:7TM-DISM receptor extracellular domain-containing protein n=1 Tax=Paraglaciecola algarum TaxID=3050085 RepID=A0ABS9DE41_9ALTE|nr:hypothetical protein [Paraglaciecola sp. G1-23]
MLIVLQPIVLWAQSDIQLISTDTSIRLSPQLKVFRESNLELTLDQIVDKKSEFTWQAAGKSNYGISKKGVWLHTSISNVTENKKWVIDVAFSQLEQVDIYLLENNQIIAHSNQGKKGESHQYRFPTLEVTLPYVMVKYSWTDC